MPKWKVITFWVLSIGLGLAFLPAGGMKLAGAEEMVASFARWGVPPFMMYVAGAVELAGALLLFVPKTRFYGGVLLASTMVGAVLTHVVSGVDMQMIGANLVFGSVAGLIAFAHRPEWLLGGSQFARAQTA